VKDESTGSWAALWQAAIYGLDHLEHFMLWVAHWPRGVNAPKEDFSFGELLFMSASLIISCEAAFIINDLAGEWATVSAFLVGVGAMVACFAALQRGLRRQKKEGATPEKQALRTPRSLRLPIEFIAFGVLCVAASIVLARFKSEPTILFFRGLMFAGTFPSFLVGFAGLFDHRVSLAVGKRTRKLAVPILIRAVARTLYYGGLAAGAYTAYRVFDS
jgi:hypothetical protein